MKWKYMYRGCLFTFIFASFGMCAFSVIGFAAVVTAPI